MSQPCTLGAAGRWLPPPRAAAAAPLRRLTHSPSRLPARLCFFPPPLPETLGVEAGACAVRWQPGALAQSPAGRPPHHHHHPPRRRYIRVTARPPARPVPRGAARLAPPPPPPSPPARAAPALSPSAPSPARGSGHAAAVAASGRAGGGGGSGSRSGSRPASPSAGRLGECQRRGGKEWRAGGRGGAPRCIPRVPLSPFPPGPGLPLRGRGLSPPAPARRPGSHLLLSLPPSPRAEPASPQPSATSRVSALPVPPPPRPRSPRRGEEGAARPPALPPPGPHGRGGGRVFGWRSGGRCLPRLGRRR